MHIIVFEDPGTFEDPTSFAARARPVLRADRGAANVISTWLFDGVSGKQLQPTRWFLLVDRGRVVAVAMQSKGVNVVISSLEEDVRAAAVATLAEKLVVIGDPVPGVSAKEADAEAFSHAWRSQSGGTPHVTMNDLVYEIDHPPTGPAVDGAARAATPGDAPLLGRWMTGFIVEAFPQRPGDDPVAGAAKRVSRGGLHVWERDGEPVSMAGLNGPADGVARIGPVYTPPEFRRQGFGTALTAHVTRQAMDRGAEVVMLFADRDNPASNRVYSGLGFQQVGTSVMLAFEADDDR